MSIHTNRPSKPKCQEMGFNYGIHVHIAMCMCAQENVQTRSDLILLRTHGINLECNDNSTS